MGHPLLVATLWIENVLKCQCLIWMLGSGDNDIHTKLHEHSFRHSKVDEVGEFKHGAC
jgi:hypothetical protein